MYWRQENKVRLGHARIGCVNQIDDVDPRRRIREIGGISGKRRRMSQSKAIELIERGTWTFYVEVDD